MTMVISSENLMHPIVEATIFVKILRTRKKLLPRIKLFWSTLIKRFGKVGSLKYLSVIFQKISTIQN